MRMRLHLQPGNTGYVQLVYERRPVELIAVANDTVGVTCPFEQLPLAGSLADLVFTEDRCVAYYHMQVVVAPNEPEDGIILQRAASATYAQRRKTWRVPLTDTIAFQRYGDTRPGEAIVVNVSCDGLLLVTRMPLEVNDMLDLFLVLPDQPARKITGRVVRCETTYPGRFGILFVQLSAESKRALTLFMWQQLRKLYPREIASLWPGSGRYKKLKKMQEAKQNENP